MFCSRKYAVYARMKKNERSTEVLFFLVVSVAFGN